MAKSITPPWGLKLCQRIEEATGMDVSSRLDLCLLYTRDYGDMKVENMTAEQLSRLTKAAKSAGLLEPKS